jgi:hypothetical protein
MRGRRKNSALVCVGLRPIFPLCSDLADEERIQAERGENISQENDRGDQGVLAQPGLAQIARYQHGEDKHQALAAYAGH